ncbi:MAG TPA: PhnD/SsuA/transferrin family substrate-binding protein [Aggregatilineales bacterium]|nr:PhnD/SsuA/transferrin family substrate-binding protein [Aggregatilineales bacterium]
MSNFRPGVVVLGAVAYAPKVITIWEGFKEYFVKHDLPFDYILYSNYETQVEALLAGHIDVAWNSPLAWIRTERLASAHGKKAHALAMRDADCDLTSIILVKADSPVQTVADLKGKTVAVGAVDSPQATLLPLEVIRSAGLEPGRDFTVQQHNVLSGKHGDHVGGESDAVSALWHDQADAACILKANYPVFVQQGFVPADKLRVLAETPRFDHCNFTAIQDVTPLLARFRELLLNMRFDDPKAHSFMEMEGVKRWLDGRTEGYRPLVSAVDHQHFYAPDGQIAVKDYSY